MRRLLMSLLVMTCLATLVGCSHTAGICDCDPSGACCPNPCPPWSPAPGHEIINHHQHLPAPVHGKL